jgi:hypothetical protein
MTPGAHLQGYLDGNIGRISAFRMDAPWAVADLATGIFEPGGLFNGSEPAGTPIAGGVALEAFIEFSSGKFPFHPGYLIKGSGLLGVGFETCVLAIMAFLTRL